MSPQFFPSPPRRSAWIPSTVTAYLPTSWADVSGLVVTDTFGSGAFLILATLQAFNAGSGATRLVSGRLTVDGVPIGQSASIHVPNNNRAAWTLAAIVQLTGGLQTVKVQALADATPAIDLKESTLTIIPA